jgi:hypothetical protein
LCYDLKLFPTLVPGLSILRVESLFRVHLGQLRRPPQPDRFEAVTAGEDTVGVGDRGSFAVVFAVDGADDRAAHVRVQNFNLKQKLAFQ